MSTNLLPAVLPRPVAERKVDPPLGGRVAVAPPLDEARRIRIMLRILCEFHEGAGGRLVEMRQIEAEFVGLMFDVARKTGIDRRERERDDARDQQEPRQRG